VLEDQHMSVQEAAEVVQDARARASRELVISTPLVYLAWGLVWLLGYGAMWLSVRGQHPYTGPSGPAVAAVLVLAALAITAVRNRRILVLTWATGYLALLIAAPALSSSVSTRTLAFLSFAGPVLLAGLVYILASALGRYRSAFVLGAWLVIVGASCAWQAPAAILGICALAGGGAFLLMAAIESRLRAHDR